MIAHVHPRARVRIGHAPEVSSGSRRLVCMPQKCDSFPLSRPTTKSAGPEQISCCQRVRALS